MQAWAENELRFADLGDKRLNRRLIKLVEALAAQPTASVPQATGSWANTKAAYRFWDLPHLKAETIRSAHYASTQQRLAAHSTILAIQDTTDLDFTHHPKTKGLGYLETPYQQGLKVHSVLAVSVAGVPLGILDQQVWHRPKAELGKARQRRTRASGAKESQRWLDSQHKTLERVPQTSRVITIADREADIYALFAQPRRKGAELLIRSTHNRKLQQESGYLQEVLRSTAPAGRVKVKVERGNDRPARQAKLTIRYCKVELAPPRHHLQRSQLKAVKLQAILLEEESPPKGIKPLSWTLLTSLEVDSLAEAVQCAEWYCLRWLVERYHYVLKSGCGIEELQLEKAERIERALATYSIVAWRLLWLTYEVRRDGAQSCEVVLERVEWQSLYCHKHGVVQAPQKPPSLREAVGWIAQLGGFMGRKGDGEPGVKTIWRGLKRLNDIASTWSLVISSLECSPSQSNTYG